MRRFRDHTRKARLTYSTPSEWSAGRPFQQPILDKEREAQNRSTIALMNQKSHHQLIATLTLAFLPPGPSFSQAVSGQHPEEFQGTVTRQVQMRYLLFIA